MSLSQSLLDKFGLKPEDLNAAERQTYQDLLKKLETAQITIPDVKAFVERINASLQEELVGLGLPTNFWQWLFRSRHEVYLKARLKNNLMLLDFLSGPERARKWAEQQLANVKPRN